MKIINKVKLREEVDYEALCRKLENQVDLLTAEVERQQKLRENEKYMLDKELKECQDALIETKKSSLTRSEVVVSSSCSLEGLCELSPCGAFKAMVFPKFPVFQSSNFHFNFCCFVTFKCWQFLQKENMHLKGELSDILSELKSQKDQNGSLHEVAANLEKQNEVYHM